MSNLCNENGRAYEYICLVSLADEIGKFRNVRIVENQSYFAVRSEWDALSVSDKRVYRTSACAAIPTILELEPRIAEQSDDVLELLIQPDRRGEEGDVRDILIIRSDISWEIGLSIKHNHFAVKHSRLSNHIDFGDKWFGYPCSQQYWDRVLPVFNYLQLQKENNVKFSELPDKERDVYIPIISAFVEELQSQYDSHNDVAAKMVEYLLGKYDFYKIISMDRERNTKIQSYNLRDTLNQNAISGRRSSITVPVASLPTRIVSLGIVPNSTNTVELYLDGGWSFSFRIHNAETYVKPTLKFDIQIIGVPVAIITIDCIW